MIILTNGYKLPETGDFGNVWFVALEDNIQRVNDHNHDGTNSEILPSSSFQAAVISVVAANFSPSGNEFRATINILGGASIDTKSIIARDPVTKDVCYLKVEKISASSFYLYTNIVQDFEVLIV
jgi:hypothetical protein